MKLFYGIALIGATQALQMPIQAFKRTTLLRSSNPADECGVDMTNPCGPDMEANKKKGGGAPPTTLNEPFELFDPEEEAKLQGTGDLRARLELGAKFNLASGLNSYYEFNKSPSPPDDVMLSPCQDFLEHLDDNGTSDPPMNTIKAKAPGVATVLGVGKLITEDAPGDIRHVVLSVPEGFHYTEGQSLSVIPPGVDGKGKKYAPRLYSIASTRYGDTYDGKSVSLCVRRAEYYDPVTGNVDPEKKGVCSDFLCNLKPGDVVDVAGPVGKTMCLPKESLSTTPIIMIGTGTGVAPFRSFAHRLFVENTVASHIYKSKALLYLGVPVTGGLLYKSEFDHMERQSGGKFEAKYAISREMANEEGGKMYVQDLIKKDGDMLFDMVDNEGAVVYFCGLKGMMPGVLEAFEGICVKKGLDFKEKMGEWKKAGKWHVEVY
ncbi:hypothetical protein TrST_g12662 [Triparma strigata]|uniref:ferredoxin--NADP(+) reductase n=1 Tax=Triparma strigata TaxID=1606541 RepID=A0A9W7BW48_9STRA|nr:hypothetical protein TrST_g12662 [Triparma strigata]